MKICKKLIALLMALMIVLSLATEVFAAGSQVEVKSGSKEATVTFTIEDVLAFEGTINTVETVGFLTPWRSRQKWQRTKMTKPTGS